MLPLKPFPLLPEIREDFRKPAVLCVDDDLHILSSLRRLLRDDLYRVVIASCAASAFAVLRRQPVAVVISDERMPVISGLELLAEVRERWPSTARILLTGHPERDFLVRGLETGLDLMITKPWDGDSLKGTVRRLVEDMERGA